MDRDNVIMIVTLGTRDVTLDGKIFSEIEFSEDSGDLNGAFREMKSKYILTPRYGGEFLYNNYNVYKERLAYPIVQPCVEEVISCNKCIDKIILISTDQQDKQFNYKDSLYFGKIILKYLYERNKKHKFFEKIDTIELNGNVADLGEMNKSIDKIMKCNRNFRDLDSQHVKVYIENIGGIDAINTSILINGINKFGNKCEQLYIDGKSGVVYSLGFINEFLLNVDKNKLKFSIKNYDYASCSIIIKNQSKLQQYSVLIQIAQNRLAFNFDTVKKISNEYLKEANDNQKIIDEVKTNLIEVSQMSKNQSTKIKELYINCRIKYIQEQYVDFLLRVFRLEESLSRYTVEKYLNIYTDKSKHGDFKEFTSKIKENSYLCEYLDSYKVCGTKLTWENNCNVKILSAILDFVIDVNKSKDGQKLIDNSIALNKINCVCQLTKTLNKLSELRNKSIGAHGFDGVSRERISDILKKDYNMDINKLFDLIEKTIDVKFECCCYERINNLILSNL